MEGKMQSGRKSDYWYLDQHRSSRRTRRLLRTLMLAVALTIVLYTGACGGDMNRTFTDIPGEQSSATRSASDLLGTTTTTVDSTLTATADTAATTVTPSASASVTLEGGNWAVYLTSSGDTLKDARVVCSTGESLGFSLSDYSAKLSFPKQKNWNFVAVNSSSGSKWYFDNAGLLLPSGYAPKITVFPLATSLTGSSSYTVSSSDAISEVRFFYNNGNVGSATPDKNGKFTAQYPVSYIAIGVKYDSSSKWYFDRSGLPLPTGYKPMISSAWKNQSLSLTSSDLYDKVVIYFTDYTKDIYSTNESSGLYKPFRARTADGFMVRLKSDGSKWYFDNAGIPVPAGSKWFSDMD